MKQDYIYGESKDHLELSKRESKSKELKQIDELKEFLKEIKSSYYKEKEDMKKMVKVKKDSGVSATKKEMIQEEGSIEESDST